MTQFLIEEAVMERLEVTGQLRKSRAAGDHPVEPADEFESQRAAHAELMAKHRANTGAA